MPTRQTSSTDIVARARNGFPDALAELYRLHGNSMMALAYRLTSSTRDAEDVLHDVFLGLPEALRRYEERGALEAWLKRITARVALSKMRSRTQHQDVSIDSISESAHETRDSRNHDRLNDLIAVETAIDALPEILRTVFVLREIEGYSHDEIADLLNIKVGTSEVRLHRALKILRKALVQP